MRKSARSLGQDYGLTAQEMNFVLKEEGYLNGESGDYTVTEKGEKYAEERDYHRGTGGYAHYNRYWTTRTWNDEIQDEIDITEERIREIRQAIALAKQKVNAQEEEYTAVEYYENSNENTSESNTDVFVIAVSTLLTAAATYGIYKTAPHIKRWWSDTAVPGLKKAKNKLTGSISLCNLCKP
ncbi:hypothetical protein [Ruminiclostridium cellobioparum]|uniref:hypothetical protein n=1 Tax=Ruminiclostridium cellobioparum TaxID=29355 RepID=UPI000488EDBB|nr:hypothetical protein [Ruminiclostridium cellobioparum]